MYATLRFGINAQVLNDEGFPALVALQVAGGSEVLYHLQAWQARSAYTRQYCCRYHGCRR